MRAPFTAVSIIATHQGTPDPLSTEAVVSIVIGPLMDEGDANPDLASLPGETEETDEGGCRCVASRPHGMLGAAFFGLAVGCVVPFAVRKNRR